MGNYVFRLLDVFYTAVKKEQYAVGDFLGKLRNPRGTSGRFPWGSQASSDPRLFSSG